MFILGQKKEEKAPSEIMYGLPGEEMIDFIPIHYHINTVAECMKFSYNIEEKEKWRVKLVELQIQHARKIEELRIKYGDEGFLKDKIIISQMVDWQNNKLLIMYREVEGG